MEERTPLAGAEVELEESRPSEEEDEEDAEDEEKDEDQDEEGQTHWRVRKTQVADAEAVQQVACVLPFEEEAEVRAVREEEASFLAALGLTEGGKEGDEEGEAALEAEEVAIFAQLLHGSSDGSRDAQGGGRADATIPAPCAADIAVPAGMPAPSCPLLMSASQRQRRQPSLPSPSPAQVAAEDSEETDQDSDGESTAGVAVATAVTGERARTISQRWAITGVV